MSRVPTRVFRAWTDPAQLARWADPEPGDAGPKVDLRIGGPYTIPMRRPDGVVHRVVGIYRVVDPPRRLVYTWRWATIPTLPETVVTVEFRLRTDGGTDLVLVHEGLPDDAAGRRHGYGWSDSMAKLVPLVDPTPSAPHER
ncbi:MAG: SRPBCC domain-containing protein [Gemmatimonadota bacterium]|nr:SRPBCC domain-containing protein [Gemmatimonadota bacterium]